MEKYKVELLPAAYEDINDIFDYILIDDPTSAENMLNNILTSLQPLESFPNSGIRVTEKSLKSYDFRMVIIEPYIAFYRFVDNKVYIYRILSHKN